MGNVATDVNVYALMLWLLCGDVVVIYAYLLCIPLLPLFCLFVAGIELNAEVLCRLGEYNAFGERTACDCCFGCCLPLVEQRAVVVLVYYLAGSLVYDAEVLFAIVERVDERNFRTSPFALPDNLVKVVELLCAVACVVKIEAHGAIGEELAIVYIVVKTLCGGLGQNIFNHLSCFFSSDSELAFFHG